MTENQIAALKYLILASKSSTILAKKVAFFLIDQSERLTQEVCISLIDGMDGYDASIVSEATRIESLTSCNGDAHIHQVMRAMGSDHCFSIHYGDFDPKRDGDPFNTDGQFAGAPLWMVHGGKENPNIVKEGLALRYTFWLARKFYARNAKYLQISRQGLEAIDLTVPRLNYGQKITRF
jgi:hypothetical protein